MWLAAAVLGVAAAGLAWQRLADGALPRWGWTGTEQASWIAALIGGPLALVGTVAAVVGLRPARQAARPPGRAPVQVGRIPPPAAWLQDRRTRIDLAAAARTGRTAVLTQVLSGMGGVGKTQLAAQFARTLRSSGELDLLVWITADSPEAIIAGYAQAATALGQTPDNLPPEQAAGRLLGWLETTSQRWLVVLDNLDRPADATGWWPPNTPTGRTVATTRRRDATLTTDTRTLIPVDLFTPGEARDYLAHAIGDPTRLAEVDDLAADLGYLPVALAQAAAYLREQHLDCAAYRTLLAEHHPLAELLPAADALPDDHRRTVDATWSLSIQAADHATGGLARSVLALAALCDPNAIPAVLFTTPAVLDFLTSTVPDTTAVDAATVERVLQTLHRYTLATRDPATGYLRMHALVQRATRDQLTPAQLQAAARVGADALITIWPDIERDTALGQILRANTSALTGHAGDLLSTPDAHPVLYRAGRSLGEAGLVTQAAAAFEQLLTDCRRVLGDDHPDTLTTRNNLAYWRGQAGDPAGAATAFEQLLTDRRRVLGHDHPDTLTTRHNLARWRGEAGDPAGAATATEQLLTDRRRVLGDDHPDTLTTRHNLAYWRGQAGDPAGAATAFEQLLTDWRRVLGDDHPDTLNTRHSLASWRGEAGDPAGAATAFEQLLTDWRRVLGDDHPDTLNTRHSLASWRGEAGDPAGAATATEQLLTDRRRVLGDDHPDTLTTRGNLARWRGQAGDPAGAATAFEQLLADRRRVLGDDHPDTLTTRHNLARWRGEAVDRRRRSRHSLRRPHGVPRTAGAEDRAASGPPALIGKSAEPRAQDTPGASALLPARHRRAALCSTARIRHERIFGRNAITPTSTRTPPAPQRHPGR